MTLMPLLRMPSNGVCRALLLALCLEYCLAILYPQDSESRETKLLDGIWQFQIAPPSDPSIGFRENWPLRSIVNTGSVQEMPVPSSFNDITQSKELRDHVGWVWYQHTFFCPSSWQTKRVFLRFGSVHYHSEVYLNGDHVMEHSGGHLPFETEVTDNLLFGGKNQVMVAVNNTLSHSTIPQSDLKPGWSDGIQRQELWFDFFNYAGIHRHVFLYTTPTIYIKDIHIHTGLNGDQGVVNYIVIVNGATKEDKLEPYIALYDSDGHLVDEKFSLQGTFIINDPHLWWPLFMHPQPGYLYSLQVSLCNPNSLASSDGDIYRLPVGIRHLQWNDTSLTINGKPLYLRGFGKHEDFHVKGKGEDLSVLIKDFNLLKWVGANSFRTSHYPYSEETMYMADRHGILIIDETPAVSLRHFKKEVLDLHTQILQELISRDKNHPSVIMWSLGNECQTVENSSRPYFQHLSELARTLDKTRPITLVLNAAVDKDHVGDLLDVVSVNRYFGWYEDPGQTEVIGQKVQNEYHAWHAKYHKPVLVTEYGAGAVAGLHNSPGFVFTEDYQVELLLEHFKAYAGLRQEEGSFLIGEMIWNFADFMTDQDSKRVYGNRKGIFTRDRQPKAGAHIVRCHYFALAKELDSFNSTHLCYPSFYGG